MSTTSPSSSAESIFERYVQYGYSPQPPKPKHLYFQQQQPHNKFSTYNFIPPALDATADSNENNVEDDNVIIYRRNSSLALNSLNAALGRK
ncbi:hypothetical protein G210_4914 [Candida maltosa Xu316]|uniref:Uncharacterized protein n=1 Tax=Candida maltosa (strain Xu316) TaxID=1245528 RepID=M3JD28_CANMX|nr:hypothetical protein G210_4914 [Candida maltosa Xu316]